MNKVDLKLNLKHRYKPAGKEYAIVNVPPMNFLMVNGADDPRTATEPHCTPKAENDSAAAYSSRLMMMAQARVEGLTLISHDPTITQ
jgi:hypothetical protein